MTYILLLPPLTLVIFDVKIKIIVKKR